ncbi:MAG: hypothetical protein KGH57_00260 [Candidatus Micrarchaeota archaeon]|nr:hypothetical protein [Candidatus Micrarchaeota archaeon]
MKKNLFYIGIVLIIAGIAVFVIGPSSVIPSIFPNATSQSIEVAANSINAIPMPLSQAGLPVLTFNSSTSIDFFFTNATAYGQISAPAADSSAMSKAVALEGNGVYEVYVASKKGAFPYLGYANITSPNYLLNVSFLQPGTYYAIFYDPGSIPAGVTITTLSVSLSKIQSGATSIYTAVGVAVVLFVAGLGLTIYSLISKDKKTEQAEMDTQAAHEYEKMDKQKGGKRKS